MYSNESAYNEACDDKESVIENLKKDVFNEIIKILTNDINKKTRKFVDKEYIERVISLYHSGNNFS